MRLRRTLRRIVVFLVIIALVGAGGYYGISYMKKNNEKEVVVVEVSSITADDYFWFGSDSSLTGNVVTNVIQNVRIDKDVIIEELLVEEGDTVKTGDKLMTFDLTLVDMELNIMQLKKQQQELDLKKAERRLYSLKNGGPVLEEDSTDAGTYGTDTASAMPAGSPGGLVAAAFPILLAADLLDLEEELTGEDLSSHDYEPPTESYVDPSQPYPTESDDYDTDEGFGDDELISGDEEIGPSEPSGPEEAPYEAIQGPTPTPIAADPALLDGIVDGMPEFYQVLDYESEPFTGTGTEDDPLVFLCSNARGAVTVKGSFFNKMAGYNDDGSLMLKPGGYWYILEFHEKDTIASFEDRTASSVGYYYINGAMLERPVNPFAEAEFVQEGAQQYVKASEGEEEPDDTGDYGGDSGGGDASLSRAEAVKAQESRIRSLNISLKETDLAINKLMRKASMKEIYSMIDGVVTHAGDPVEGTNGMESFLRINSAEGYYIKGTVNEMKLDQIAPGTILTCTTDMGEEFEAEVISVADYPTTGDSYYGWSDGNPNTSSYSFSANILEEYKDLSINQDTYLMNINLPTQEEEDDGIRIPKAFVRTQNGVSYIMKESKGVLKKQAVKISKTDPYGSSVTISQGITLDDWIAFPYAEDSKEGVKTRKGTRDELYNYQ